MKKIDIADVMELILKDAKNNAENAGYAGRQDDGGARELRAQVKFYRDGMNNVIPQEWFKYVEKIKITSDPEFSNYIRLKKKFENE